MQAKHNCTTNYFVQSYQPLVAKLFGKTSSPCFLPETRDCVSGEGLSLPNLITHRAKNMCNAEDAADLRKLMACAKLPKLQQGCNGKGKYLCDYMQKDPRNAFVVLVGEHEHTYDKDMRKAALNMMLATS